MEILRLLPNIYCPEDFLILTVFPSVRELIRPSLPCHPTSLHHPVNFRDLVPDGRHSQTAADTPGCFPGNVRKGESLSSV